LEERLISFSVSSLKLVESMLRAIGARALASQYARSGTAPALNYGEAQAAESDRDFIHKLKVCLKELRESHVCLKIILQMKYLKEDRVIPVENECNELIAILVTSIRTKQSNMTHR
jgi:four helix bundle protein